MKKLLLLLFVTLYVTQAQAQQELYIDSSKGFAISGYYGSGEVSKGGAGMEYFLNNVSFGVKYLGGNNDNFDINTNHSYRNTIAGTLGLRVADNIFIKASIGSTAVENYPAYDSGQPDEFYSESYFDIGAQLFVNVGQNGARFIPELFVGNDGVGFGFGFKF